MAINLSNILQQAQRDMRTTGPKRSGVGGSTANYTPNTGQVVVPNPTSTALPNNASIGEASRFLYDTRLQNVFNDYQQQVASLEQSEQKQLQDAFFIRELSKKYLGEYASNVGMGDVSGNLLDIYGAYQQNVTAIQQQSDQLKLSLQQSYDQQSRAAFEGAIEAQLQAEQLQLDENARTTLFNVTQGNMGGMEWDDYLQSQLSSGTITQQSYQVLFTQVYDAKLAEVEANLDRNFYGFKTDAEGNRVMMTKEEYIDANKGWLNASDLQKLKDYAMISNTGALTIKQTETPAWFSSFGLGGDGFSFEITDEDGNVLSFVTAPQDVDNDTNARIKTSTEDLTDAFEEKYPTATLVSGQTTFQYKGNYYYYVETATEGGKWFRAINYTATAAMYDKMTKETDATIAEQWKMSSTTADTMLTQYFEYNKRTGVMTLTDATKTQLKHATKAQFEFDGTTITTTNDINEELDLIRATFVRIHGGGFETDGVTPQNGWNSIKNRMVFHQGFFYFINAEGKIRKLVRA